MVNRSRKGLSSSIIKSVEGDSIITIPADSIAVNIPLTIKADDYYEYDQKLRVGISILSILDDNDAGSMGDESVFTYTIIDDDSEPYIRFEADVIANETNANSINEAVTVSLVNSSGEFVQSEKPITATYALDIEKGDSEIEYTSGSLDSDDTYDKYSDDFSFSNGDLSFAVRTYSYSPAPADSFIVTNGDTSKDITLTIFGDDLYEVDEYVNIEISTVTNAQPKEASASDFSYVYTIQNDDAMPSVNWSDSNPTLITEGDPEGLGEEGDYINNAIKVALSKESGTDILVEYSLVTDEAQKGTATAGIDNNFDINLADDNPTFNTKTIIILAATDAESELTASIPITVWDDFIVESTDDAENETFKLQIDKYRDKGEDGDWDNTEDTDDSIKVEVQFSKMQEVTIIDNDTPPSEFDVGSVITKTTSTEPIVDSHWNPVKAGYWNSYNTGLEITVPIENNSKLEGGSVKLIARIAGGTPVSNFTDEYEWADLTTESILITSDKISVDEENIVFEVSAEEFEDIAADPLWYVEGSEVDISAIITDVYGNERIGNPSVITITIDETVPSVDDYKITSVSASGGNEFANYWNSTNTGLDVIIKPQKDPSDASVSGGSVRVLAGIGADSLTADYYQLGDPVLINAVNNNVNDGIPIAIVKDSVISQIDYDQGRAINLKAEIVDIAGNKRMLDIATQGVGGKIVIDTVHASVDVTYSRKFVNESHSPTITATYDDNDPPFSTPRISVEFFGTNDDSDIIAVSYTHLTLPTILLV